MSEQIQVKDEKMVDEPGSETGQALNPIKIENDQPTDVLKIIDKRLKDVEICVPIVYGTVSFWLGKKATETQSHKWTIYVRGASNEDLGVVIKQVVFQLHPSFKNPHRVVDSPPFELSECGWGEFEIAITILFHSDVSDKPMTLYHTLKLYSDEEYCPPSVKKPVVVESYDEIVLLDPSEAFFARAQNHPALIVHNLPADFVSPPGIFAGDSEDGEKKKPGDTKDHPLGQYFTNFSEADELLKLTAARQQVQAYIAKMKRQMSALEGATQPPEPAPQN